MYIPSVFEVQDVDRLIEFMAQNSFAILVSQHSAELTATHLPLLIERLAGEKISLCGHVARANPQWKDLAGKDCLAIFSGPHVYVSPSWYDADRQVPTWNYVAVHASGTVELIDDPEDLIEVLQKSVAAYERSMPTPWMFDRSTGYIDQMAKQIVGLRIRVSKLEGKWKLNQNHPLDRQAKVVQALRNRPDENSQAIAALMRQEMAKADRTT